MELRIKTYDGVVRYIEINEESTVLDIKNKIKEATGFLPNEQRLHSYGKILQEGRSLTDYPYVNYRVAKDHTTS